MWKVQRGKFYLYYNKFIYIYKYLWILHTIKMTGTINLVSDIIWGHDGHSELRSKLCPLQQGNHLRSIDLDVSGFRTENSAPRNFSVQGKSLSSVPSFLIMITVMPQLVLIWLPHWLW